MCLTGTSRSGVPLNPGTSCSLLTTESKSGKFLRDKISLWRQEDPLFRYVMISLPVRGHLGNCYFLHLFFKKILFNPHTRKIKSGQSKNQEVIRTFSESARKPY